MKSFATMMKLALCAALLFTSADATLAQTPKKRVLLEDGTGAWCGYCPRGATTLEKIVEKYPDQVIGVGMHNADAMSVPEEPQFSSAYMYGYPGGVIDRGFYQGKSNAQSGDTKSDVSDNAWESVVVSQLALGTNADVMLNNMSYDTVSRELSFTVAAKFTSAMSGDYRFNAYVVEDSVVGSGTGYDQANYMNGDPSSPWYQKGNPIKGFVHRHVVRAVMDGMFGVKGSLPASITANNEYSTTYSITLPTNWNAKRMTVVGFVMKYDTDAKKHQVLNAVEAEVSGTPQTSRINVTGETFVVQSSNTAAEVPFEISNISDAAITYEWTMTKSTRTPSDWSASLTETGEFTVAAGETKNLKLMLTPGATVGIGDATVSIKEKGNPLSKTFKANVTVLSKEIERLNVTLEDELATASLGAAITASGRTNYIDVSSADFTKAANDLTNLKTVIWTAGQKGMLDDETANTLVTMLNNGVGVLITGSAAVVAVDQSALTSMLGISYVSDILNTATFTAIGYTNDPVSAGYSAPVTLLPGGFWAQQFNIEDESTTKAMLRLQSANKIIATRTQLENARAIQMSFNPLAITDVAKRNSLIDKAITWIETAAAPTAKLDFSVPMLDFEEVKENETKEMTVDIMSNGGAPLVISGLEISGTHSGNYTLINAPTFPLTLNAGEKTTVTVKFSPNAKGDFIASLDIMSNAEGTNSLILAGIGIAGGTSVNEFTSGSLEFLTVKVGPNPANDKAQVSYSIRGLAPQTVELSIIDVLGNTVHNFGVKTLTPGTYSQEINAAALASGNYRLVARSNEAAVQVPFVIAR